MREMLEFSRAAQTLRYFVKQNVRGFLLNNR